MSDHILRNLIIAVATLSFVTFVALFGQLPALRKTPIGWLQRALCLHIPDGLKAVDRRVTGGVVTTKSQRLGNYLFYEKNPVVLILFLFILTGSASIFLWNGASRLPTSLILPIPFFLGAPYVFTYLCVTSTSQLITPSTHSEHMNEYPYDHILFRPQKSCSTCNLPKPARSKHCSLCRTCVAKADHHCPWVNACLGRGNYRHFLALLLSLSALEFYGAYLCYYILRPNLQTNSSSSLFSSAYASALGNAFLRAVARGGLSIAGVGMLASSTAFLPLGLLAYHLYLIWAGMTTNESQKWADWRDDMDDGCVFIASRKALRAHLAAHKATDATEFANGSIARKSFAASLGLDDGGGDEAYVSWPVKSDQIVVITNDGRPPQGQDGLWRRVWSLNEVENLYDLGGWDNFMEVLRGR